MTLREGEPALDFHTTVSDLNRIKAVVFGGFQRCLFTYSKVRFRYRTAILGHSWRATRMSLEVVPTQ